MVLLVAIALMWCAYKASRSDSEIAPKVTTFLVSLLFPMLGNLLMIIAETEGPAAFGRYLYFIGIDIAMYCLLDFTLQYCDMKWTKGWHRLLITCIAIDIIQVLLNPVFHHAFEFEKQMAYGAPYYNVRSYFGRNIHLAMIYAIMGIVLFILLYKAIRSARIYSEKYTIMFFLLLMTGLWELFYLFSHSPVKRSVIAYGVFGLLAFYFSLYYRPMRLLDHMLAETASGLTGGLFLFDEGGKCIWADEKGQMLIGVRDNDFVHCKERLIEAFPDIELEQREWKCQQSMGDRYYDLMMHTIYDAGNRVVGSVLSMQDDTENEMALQYERYIASHDALTGVFTKEHLYEVIRKQIDAEPDTDFYVAYIDVNNFKFVNDMFGHEFGDYALRSIASDLCNNLPPGTPCGRLGGDSFGFCIKGEGFDPHLAEKYMAEFTISNNDISHKVVIHQGVYKVTERDIDVSVMFDRAHMAQQTIKNDYKRHIAMYDDAMRDRAMQDQNIALELPDALSAGDIQPYLQAIVDKDGTVIGAEALVRWIHPQRGFMSPAEFIPVIESNGMIADVDRYMWGCACRLLKKWEQSAGLNDLFISVNVSPKDFYFMDVKDEMESLVREYDIPPERLRVEITESVMMDDINEKVRLLDDMREYGFVLEMDDFGSGYSSLNMLKSMPVDIVKIDMTFVEDLNEASRTLTILRNLLNMMSELGLTPLTEGVETETQHRILAQMGCGLFQGYLFARPMPVEQFERNMLGL